jgi:hypothetical protein
MRWNAIWSSGNSSSTPGMVRAGVSAMESSTDGVDIPLREGARRQPSRLTERHPPSAVGSPAGRVEPVAKPLRDD